MIEEYGNYEASMFGSRVRFDRNDFLSPVQEISVPFPRQKAFSEDHIKINELQDILEFHTQKRDQVIPNHLPVVPPPTPKDEDKEEEEEVNHKKPMISIPPRLGKRKISDVEDYNTPDGSVREPPMKKINLGSSKESGRDLKRRAERMIESDPKKGCFLYVKAGIEFLKDAYHLEAEGKNLQSCSYYRDNFEYFFKIVYISKKYNCQNYISISYLGAALSGIKNFFLNLQTLNSEGRMLYHSFSQMMNKNNNKKEDKQKQKQQQLMEIDPLLRNRTMSYILDMNNMVRVFQSMDEVERRIPRKYHPTPLQKDMRNVDSSEVISYMNFLLDEFEKDS